MNTAFSLTPAERAALVADGSMVFPAPRHRVTEHDAQAAYDLREKYHRVALAYLDMPQRPQGYGKALAAAEGLSYGRLQTTVWRLRRERLAALRMTA